MKTYDYVIRVSEMGNRDETAMTITDQRKASLAEIARHKGRPGLELDATDVSGGVVIDSAAYQQALQRVKDGQSKGLVMAYSSRFARNAWAVGRYLEQLQKADGELWFADRPGIDYRTPSGATVVTIDAVMNSNYLQECKTKAERTIEEKLVAEGIPNAVPYGYRRNGTYIDGKLATREDLERDGKALMPDPTTAPIVVRIFKKRKAKQSWTSIAEGLDADGIPSPRAGGTRMGKPSTGLWSVATVRGIVKNEAYLGVVRYERREHRRGPKTGEVVRHENAHPALVSKTLWNAAQSAKTVQRNGMYAAGVAGGLVHCSSCGGLLSVTGSGANLVYGCRRQQNKHRCPAPVNITKRIVDEWVDQEVEAALAGHVATSSKSHLAKLQVVEAEAREELEAYLEVASARDRQKFERGLKVREERLDAATVARDEEERRMGVEATLPTPEGYHKLDVEGRRHVAGDLLAGLVITPAVGGNPEDRIIPEWH